MYDITVPPDVEIVDTVTEKPTGQKLKWVEFMRATLLTDRRFSASQEALEQQEAIRVAIRGKGPGDTVRIHSNVDYALLLEVAKCPQYGHGQQASQGYTAMAVLCLPFLDAIRDAKKADKRAATTAGDEDAPPQPKKRLAAVDDE